MSDLGATLVLISDDPFQQRPRPVHERLFELIDALERVSARYAICGAVAMGGYGVRRFTEDIDLFIDRSDVEAALEALDSKFRELAREPADGPPKQLRLRSRAAVDEDVDIDILVPVNALEEWALREASVAYALGRSVRLVSPEALVVLKLAAFVGDREAPEMGRHRVDAARLLRETDVDVDSLRAFLVGSDDLLAELETLLAAPRPKGRV